MQTQMSRNKGWDESAICRLNCPETKAEISLQYADSIVQKQRLRWVHYAGSIVQKQKLRWVCNMQTQLSRNKGWDESAICRLNCPETKAEMSLQYADSIVQKQKLRWVCNMQTQLSRNKSWDESAICRLNCPETKAEMSLQYADSTEPFLRVYTK